MAPLRSASWSDRGSPDARTWTYSLSTCWPRPRARWERRTTSRSSGPGRRSPRSDGSRTRSWADSRSHAPRRTRGPEGARRGRGGSWLHPLPPLGLDRGQQAGLRLRGGALLLAAGVLGRQAEIPAGSHGDDVAGVEDVQEGPRGIGRGQHEEEDLAAHVRWLSIAGIGLTKLD